MSRSWVAGADGSGYGLSHLPYGVVMVDGHPVPAVRIGDHALDLRACHRAGLLPGVVWAEHVDLTMLMMEGADVWAGVRAAVTDLLSEDGSQRPPDGALVPLADVAAPTMPFTVADYVDFYSSLHHATNLGRLFRPDSDPLLPNWRHLPVGYHGRAGTVVVSGTPIHRPVGQQRPPEPGAAPPVGPSERLDIELEVGFVTGGLGTPLGTAVPASAAGDHIFGIVLVNDWSARDIQAWEYQPLGPFLGKSFATSIGPWITPLAALEAARVAPPEQDPPVSDYLRVDGKWSFDLSLEVAITPAGTTTEEAISRVSFADMYWTMPQQLAHATVNGATIRAGDLFASGTVSGPERGTEGSLIELTMGGREPITIAGVERTFLQDGDTVTLRGSCEGVDGQPVVLAEVTGTILPPG